MKVMVIEDEKDQLDELEAAVNAAVPSAEIKLFHDAETALESADSHKCDVALIDTELPKMSGISAAHELQQRNAQTNIIFVADDPQNVIEAMDVRPSGVVMRPISEEKVRNEFENLRYPVEEGEAPILFARCFGTFDAFVNGRPLPCRSAPAMELLAFLIDRRGSRCSVGQIEAAIWGGRSYSKSHQSQLRRYLSELQRALDQVGCGDVLIRQYGYLGLVESRIKCDYWDFLNDESCRDLFFGEYMTQYSWAEHTLSNLLNLYEMRRKASA